MAETVLLVGDSILGGWYATTPADGMRERIIAGWRTPDATFVRAEIAHATTNRVQSVVSVPDSVDVAVIELGTNDVGHTAPWTFRRQYARLLDQVAVDGCRVVCVGVWRPPLLAAAYDAIIRHQTRRHGATFVRICDLYARRGPAGRATFQGVSDAFHPGDEVHRLLADRVLAAVA